MSNALETLKQHSVVVADTGDFESAKSFKPQDATTNPSLIFQATQVPAYSYIMDAAIAEARGTGASGATLHTAVMDRLSVLFGREILKIVPGVVSTEVDATLSFDTKGSIGKALHIIELYKSAGVPKERILIKLASTWEGIEAMKVLEKEHGIHCNMTLIFSLWQAAAAAEGGATLISPFVGRILDWNVKAFPDRKDTFVGNEDPGVKSVTEIYGYYKKHGYKTIVMGASFRNIEEVLCLSGCDKLTVSPKLLKELEAADASRAHVRLNASKLSAEVPAKKTLAESEFRWLMNQDPMATEKLSEGIRNFHVDYCKLLKVVEEKCGGK